MNLQQRLQQYRAGLITQAELQQFIDMDNMGSDTRYITIADLLQSDVNSHMPLNK